MKTAFPFNCNAPHGLLEPPVSSYYSVRTQNIPPRCLPYEIKNDILQAAQAATGEPLSRLRLKNIALLPSCLRQYLPLSCISRRSFSIGRCAAEGWINFPNVDTETAGTFDRIPLIRWRAATPIYTLSPSTVLFSKASSNSARPASSARKCILKLCGGDVVYNLSQRSCWSASNTTAISMWTQNRNFSTSYLPKAALRRNRIPFYAFRTPRSSHPSAALREAEVAAAATAAASHVSAPFTLQKQQRLYTLLCAEDKRPADISSLFTTAPSAHTDSSFPLATDIHGLADVSSHWGKKLPSVSASSSTLPVGISGLTKFRPSSPAASNFTFRGRVVKQLSTRRINHLGRNWTGQITVRYTGAGHFQRLRLVDFKRGRKDIFATVLRLEYDPGRSAHLALIQYDDGVLSYILAAQTTRPGDRVVASEHASITPANCLPLRCIPVGSIVHNIEIRPGAGGQLVRAAGCFATVVAKDANFATLKLQSTEVRRFPVACWASIGQVSNSRQAARIRGKAGVSYWMGERPRTRGKAMNPVDHPHGGGTGKKGVKRPPVTKWGILCRGYKTRPKNKPLGLIVRRKKANKLIKKFGELGAVA